MSFHVHQSNKLGHLADILAGIIRRHPTDPLGKETFLVMSKGMARWLSFELAERLGVWAGGEFLFPSGLVNRISESILNTPDKSPETSLFEKPVLVWRLMKLFLDPVTVNGYPLIRNYLKAGENTFTSNDGNSANPRLFQLCRQLADTFDQYAVYRPELLKTWENGDEPDDWQASIWRALIRNAPGSMTRADVIDALSKAAKDNRDSIPDRLFMFGISTLPPLYTTFLSRLSDLIPVHIFFLNPCREFWADIISPGKAASLNAEAPGGFRSDDYSLQENDTLHTEIGNPLLASLGREGRDFLSFLTDYDSGSGTESFVDPGSETMLDAIKHDILLMQDRTTFKDNLAGTHSDLPFEPSPDDDSITIQVCHGPAREVEVLYDKLLDMFERDPELTPGDIVVMAPDIEKYVSHIEAVFGPRDGRESPSIPFSIADRSRRSTDPVIDSFFTIFELATGRFEAPAILSALGKEPIKGKAGFSDEELDLVRHWVIALRIRWGYDGTHKTIFEVPSIEANSWRTGLDRLLIGYALSGESESIFSGVIPFDEVEGQLAETAGKISAFMRKLAHYSIILRRSETPHSLKSILLQMADDFIEDNNSTASTLRELRITLSELGEITETAGFEGKIESALAKVWLETKFNENKSISGFLSGKVTFCSMLPMRSLPFSVVCLLGLSDTEFPGSNYPPGFDRIHDAPRPGDRSRRDDDRYQFLEAILSAEKRLYISYTGRSIRDNSPLPPSTVVEELLDYMNDIFPCRNGSIRNRIETVHPLHPFDPSYFNGTNTRLFSFSGENCIELTEPARDGEPSGAGLYQFHDAYLPLPPESEGDESPFSVDIKSFIRFFRNPSRFYLNERLGITIPKNMDTIDEDEPFTLAGLERYKLRENILRKILSGENPYKLLDVARLTGQLPHGIPGSITFFEQVEKIHRFVKELRTRIDIPGNNSLIVDIDLFLGGLHISGSIDNLFFKSTSMDEFMVSRIKTASIKAGDLLEVWLRHLLLQYLIDISGTGSSTPELRSVFAGSHAAGIKSKDQKTEVFKFSTERTTGKASDILGVLADLFMTGLREPLPFFPETSLEFIRNLRDNPSEVPVDTVEKALMRARAGWNDDFRSRKSEGDDTAVKTCFRGREPLDHRFATVSWKVLGPILEYAETS